MLLELYFIANEYNIPNRMIQICLSCLELHF
uniref:Uncharacterized protein n=1 Tax=Rhizophora mucronata TaxID=61149 RepID=A0A2P2NJK8_RHIMU